MLASCVMVFYNEPVIEWYVPDRGHAISYSRKQDMLKARAGKVVLEPRELSDHETAIGTLTSHSHPSPSPARSFPA